MSEANNLLFAIYHPHYKDKFVNNLTWALVCTANYLYFLSNFDNLSTVSFFAFNGKFAQPDLVTKKGKTTKNFYLSFFSSILISVSIY